MTTARTVKELSTERAKISLIPKDQPTVPKLKLAPAPTQGIPHQNLSRPREHIKYSKTYPLTYLHHNRIFEIDRHREEKVKVTKDASTQTEAPKTTPTCTWNSVGE